MPLSDYEKRALDAIEAAASQGDPLWAEHMAWPRSRPRGGPRTGLRGLACALVGFGMLTLGVTLASGTGTVIALIGYMIIVGWAAWLLNARLRGRAHRHE